MERSCAGGRIELRQPVERFVGISVVPPVFPHRAEVVVERAILLGKKYDVIDRRDPGRSLLEHRGHCSTGL